MKVLIAEDEIRIANSLKRYLVEEGYEVDISLDGEDALKKVTNNLYDILLLDWQMPKKDGMEVCKEIRKAKNEIPIILITAYNSIANKVEALEFGADDYVTKPFNPKEVVARIHSVLRRLNRTESRTDLKYFVFDMVEHVLLKNNIMVKLTDKEVDLLKFLINNQGIILSKNELCKKVWNYNNCPSTNLVEVTIKNLRKKFEEFTDKKIIKTIYGEGYIFLPD